MEHTVTLVPVPKVNVEGAAELAGVYCVDTRFIGLCCLEVTQVPPQSSPSSKYDRSWALWTSKSPDKVRSSNRRMFRKVGSRWPGLAGILSDHQAACGADEVAKNYSG